MQWDEAFTRTFTQDSETAAAQTVVQPGHAEGWILVGDKPGQYYILELTIEFEGTLYAWIDAWEEPE